MNLLKSSFTVPARIPALVSNLSAMLLYTSCMCIVYIYILNMCIMYILYMYNHIIYPGEFLKLNILAKKT